MKNVLFLAIALLVSGCAGYTTQTTSIDQPGYKHTSSSVAVGIGVGATPSAHVGSSRPHGQRRPARYAQRYGYGYGNAMPQQGMSRRQYCQNNPYKNEYDPQSPCYYKNPELW